VPVTLSDLEQAIRGAWSSETTFASAGYLARAPGSPARGQCGPTALVVRDLLGGDLLVSDVSVDGVVDGVHYWNRLSSGLHLDLTRDQFTVGELVLEPRVVPDPALPRPESARAAYLLLRERVLAALGRRGGEGSGDEFAAVPTPAGGRPDRDR
jgi:hypothetical protein